MRVKDITPETVAAAEEMVKALVRLWDASLALEKLVGEEVDCCSDYINYRAGEFDSPDQVRLTPADVLNLIDGSC